MSDLIIIIISVLLSAFFSGMEIAFVSSNKLRLEITKKQGNTSSRILTRFTETPSRFISTMLVGNNIALVVYGVFMAKTLEPWIVGWAGNTAFIVLLIQTIISTLIILVTAEFMPKALFRIVSNASLRLFAIPIYVFYILFFPLVNFSLWLSGKLAWIFSGIDITEKNADYVARKVDIDHFINETNGNDKEEPQIDKKLKIFQNALDFSEIKIRECMVPRTEITAVHIDENLEQLRDLFIDTGYSKIFVYDDTIDKILGYVGSHDLFKSPKSIRNMLKKAPIVPESMSAQKLFELLLDEQKSIALVVDEFGGTSGIVSIEDILEEIFGEIEDEHDSNELIETQVSEKEFIFSGRLEIDQLNEKYHLGFSESEEYETLAGYILYHHGNIPSKGEELHIKDTRTFRFQMLRISSTRIELVKLFLEN